ncbi:5-formyltetrahydrofolate cyclo-ligase [Paucihalobacter sp.]|uniref:5-formyltetrahydrofolate cyclo-ligase n=1 Tax=Paucihalobacter sp. TaxID=2850405 RepID=UPI002FE032AE
MNKSQLRQLYKEKRAQLSEAEIETFSLDIANQCLNLPIWNLNCYHIFLSIETQHEINSVFLLNILQGKDKTVVVPKTDFSSSTLKHYLLDDNTKLAINKYGIPEPVNGILINEQQIDVVFVPLLAFDNTGNRVGYGKGFYDKFLSNCKADCLKIGLSFFEAEDKIEDINATDIKLDYCVTSSEVYRF